MKLLRPASDADGAQLELPLAEAAPAVHAPAAPLLPVQPAWPVPQPNGRLLHVGERALHYTLKRSSRRTIGFTIDDRGLSITAPRWVTLADIESAILEKQRWIFNKLGEWRHREARRVLPTVQWRDGASMPFLGQPLTLSLESPIGALLFDAGRRVLHLALPAHADEQQIKDRVQGWLQQQARRLLAERLDVYADKLGVRHSGFALTSAATRWGSCTADGKIRLNWRLMHFPLSMIDYVAAHELAHLKEMNHGPRFWQTVESIFPEFRDARAQLRAHPPELLPTF
ncbi:M48 family metallopeptidase [Cupriavidus oxalaticus]|jgi:predicted metal-dependent hydrolase|uniref:M48 family metallopeptidase n=1 Tax=Cupriavidus oxalaticus TaxID=96344 RepID=UPI00403366FB